MPIENIPLWVWLIGTVAVALISAIAGVIGAVVGSRYFGDSAQAKRDDKREIAALKKENHGKEIEGEVATIGLLLKRIETLEKQGVDDRRHFDERLDRVNLRVAEEMAKSSQLIAENDALKTENKRQARRLHDLADAIQNRDGIISELRRDLETLRREFHDVQKGNQRMSDMPSKAIMPEVQKVTLVENPDDNEKKDD